MNENHTRRAADLGVASLAARTVKDTSRTFWSWIECHHVDSLSVIVITLWLSIRVVDFALDFPYSADTGLSGTDKAAIIAAVLTPWGLMQAAMFRFYVDLKGKSNGPGKVETKTG